MTRLCIKPFGYLIKDIGNMSLYAYVGYSLFVFSGNCLCFSSDTRLYDRIYCGAACPDPYENYIKHMLKVGGILVMPLNDQLLQIKRSSKNTWDVRSLLLVSFATLVQPCADNREFLRMGK